MKLKKGFYTQTIEDGQVLVPVDPQESNFRGIVRSNETAAFVVDCLKEETTRDELLQKLKDTYEGDEEKMASDLELYKITATFISKALGRIGADPVYHRSRNMKETFHENN